MIDLSDPAQPTIEGSLKIPGYSNYLQVIDEDHVLGIGRDADGGLYAGLQISLFNVADPSDPHRVATYTFEGDRNTWSSFANAWNLKDHHAITYVAEEGILALPFYTFTGWGGLGVSGDALTTPAVRVFQIDTRAEQINVLGQIDFDEEAKRTLHVDGNLYAISDSTLHITELLTPDKIIASVDLDAAPVPIKIADLEFAQPFMTDMNGDGQTSMADAVLIRDAMHDHPLGDMAGESQQNIDVDGDGQFTPRDILMVVNKAFEDHEPLTEAPRIGTRIAAAAGEMGPFQVSPSSVTLATSLPPQATSVAARGEVFDSNPQGNDQARVESPLDQPDTPAVRDDAVTRLGRVSATRTENVASDQPTVTDAAFAQLSSDELFVGPILN